jgi:hypothetical protein
VEGNDVERNEIVSKQNPEQPSSPFAVLGPGLVTAPGLAQGPRLVDGQGVGPGLGSSEDEWLHTGIDTTKATMESRSDINPSRIWTTTVSVNL